jgi:hypothetical protein
MNARVLKKNGEKIVKRVMKHWRKFDQIGKKEFEEGLDIIIENISKQTRTPIEMVAQHTHQIIKEFGDEYQNVPDDIKGYEAIISLFYFKYMQKLGLM